MKVFCGQDLICEYRVPDNFETFAKLISLERLNYLKTSNGLLRGKAAEDVERLLDSGRGALALSVCSRIAI